MIIPSDHQRLDARSLTLHRLIATKLPERPTLVEQARGTLARWQAQNGESVPVYLEWERILAGSLEEIVGLLISTSEEAMRLRQSTPFTAAGILTPEERAMVYTPMKRHRSGESTRARDSKGPRARCV